MEDLSKKGTKDKHAMFKLEDKKEGDHKSEEEEHEKKDENKMDKTLEDREDVSKIGTKEEAEVTIDLMKIKEDDVKGNREEEAYGEKEGPEEEITGDKKDAIKNETEEVKKEDREIAGDPMEGNGEDKVVDKKATGDRVEGIKAGIWDGDQKMTRERIKE